MAQYRWGLVGLTLVWVLAGCSNSSVVGGPPPPGWEPGPGYTPPQIEVFTNDMTSGGPHWDGLGFAGCQPRGFVVGLSHLYAPPQAGEQGRGRLLVAGERDEVIGALEEGMSLIRVRDGARVAVHMRDGCMSVGGELHSLLDADAVFRALVPHTPLEDGWYVFRVDLAPLRATGFPFEHDDSMYHRSGKRPVEDVLYARVHWGSQPTWARVVFSRGNPLWDIGVMASEPDASIANATLDVRYDGEPISCSRLDGDPVEPADTATATGVRCPSGDLGLPSEGTTLELTLHDTDLLRPSGAPAGTLTILYGEFFHPNDSYTSVLVEPDFAMNLVLHGTP